MRYRSMNKGIAIFLSILLVFPLLNIRAQASGIEQYNGNDRSIFKTEVGLKNIDSEYKDPYENAEEYDDFSSAEKAMGRAALDIYNKYLSEYLSDKASSEVVPLTWFENASARLLRNMSNGGKVAIALSPSGASGDGMYFLDTSLKKAFDLVYDFRYGLNSLGIKIGIKIIDSYETIDREDGYVVAVFSFSDHALDLVREFDKACDEGLSLLKDGMNDLEKVLILHNYICMINHYAYKDNGEPDSDKGSAYDSLVKRSSVCDGYTRGLNCLLRRVGIETGISRSEDINHDWNLVKLDEKWYAIDVTWDDPGTVYGVAGDYGFFLLSDDTSVLYHAANQKLATITIENKDDYDNEISAVDKRYESGYFWDEGDVTSAIYVEPGADTMSMKDDRFVYMRGTELVRRDGINGKEQTLVDVAEEIEIKIDEETGDISFYVPLPYNSLIGYGNGYLLNDSDHLYFVPNSDSMGFAGGTDQTPYFYTIPDASQYDIKGFYYSGNGSETFFTLVDTISGEEVVKVLNVPYPDPDSEVVPIVHTESMYRLYNPNSGEHFYTSNATEKNNLVSAGWTPEGSAWIAPASSTSPVYRVYNPNSGEHHYTMDSAEKDFLVSLGWKDEGIGWYSDENQGTPLYRLYNPNATGDKEAGGHHYTKDVNEKNSLITAGWKDEGIGWYGM